MSCNRIVTRSMLLSKGVRSWKGSARDLPHINPSLPVPPVDSAKLRSPFSFTVGLPGPQGNQKSGWTRATLTLAASKGPSGGLSAFTCDLALDPFFLIIFHWKIWSHLRFVFPFVFLGRWPVECSRGHVNSWWNLTGSTLLVVFHASNKSVSHISPSALFLLGTAWVCSPSPRWAPQGNTGVCSH